MPKYNFHESDIDETANAAFPTAGAAINFLCRHAIFRTEDGQEFKRALNISRTPPDPKYGRQYTILKTGPVTKTIASFDDETGMPVFEVKTIVDPDLTSLASTFQTAITKLAAKVLLRYGG